MLYHVILRIGDIALLESENDFIVACGYDENEEVQTWAQGFYFTHFGKEAEKVRCIEKAVTLFRKTIEQENISEFGKE